MSALAATTRTAKTPQQHVDALYALFDNTNRGSVMWEKLDTNVKTYICRLAGIKQRNIGKSLDSYSELEITKLLRTIKSVEKSLAPLSGLSLSDCK